VAKNPFNAGVQFVASDGSHLSNEDARVIGERLNHLGAAGPVTARRVVDDASLPDSPLHRYFMWDDSKAADRYRIEQARRLVRAVSIRVLNQGREQKSRAFHVVMNGPREKGTRTPGEYKSAAIVFNDPELSAEVLEGAKKELLGWIARYERYTGMANVVTMARHMLASLDSKAA
jgi:hypothetical protein